MRVKKEYVFNKDAHDVWAVCAIVKHRVHTINDHLVRLSYKGEPINHWDKNRGYFQKD